MKTDSTSWSQLSAEIEQYKKRAKHNLENYQRQRFNNLYRKKSQKKVNTQQSQGSLKKLAYSMNLIRERMHEEIQKKQKIHKKISFLKTHRDRKIQSSQRARKKFQKVFSIRSSSASEKELMTKQISSFNARSYYIKRQLTERAKSQRMRIQSERKKMLSQNSMKAKQVRKTRVQNEQSIVQEKGLNLAKKQKAVKKVQFQIMASLDKKREREKQIIQEGKANHYQHIRQEYLKLERTKKQNKEIFKHFQFESQKIIQQTEKAQENLKMFERLLYKKNSKCLNKYDKPEKALQKNSSQVNSQCKQNSKETTHQGTNSPKTNIFHLTN